MPPTLFDMLRPPEGRQVNPGVVSNHVASSGHALRRAEAEVEAARKAVARGTKGAVSLFPSGHAEQQLAEAEDRLRGRIGERSMTLRTIVDRVSRGDATLTTEGAPLTIDQRVAAERRSDDAEAYTATLEGNPPDPVVRELRETRREIQLLRDRLAPED